MRKILTGSVAALAIAAAVPLVASAEGHGREHGNGHGMRGEHHGGWHGDRGAKLRMVEMIEIYDADGDGSISQDEVDAWRADRLREFDADGNGELSLDEYQALWLDAMRERMVDQFQAHDDDGDGQVTVEEFGERTSQLVMMRDRNDDGVLNLDDLSRGRHGHHPNDGMHDGMHDGMPGGPGQAGEPAQPPASGQPPVEPPAAPAQQ